MNIGLEDPINGNGDASKGIEGKGIGKGGHADKIRDKNANDYLETIRENE